MIGFPRIKLDFAGNLQSGGDELSRDHSAYENGNSSRFPGTRRSTSSELIRTSRMRQRFGSTADFIPRAF